MTKVGLHIFVLCGVNILGSVEVLIRRPPCLLLKKFQLTLSGWEEDTKYKTTMAYNYSFA